MSISWSPCGNTIAVCYNWLFFSIFSASSPHNELIRVPMESKLDKRGKRMAFKEVLFIGQRQLIFALNLLEGRNPVGGAAVCLMYRDTDESLHWKFGRVHKLNGAGVVLKIKASKLMVAAIDTAHNLFLFSTKYFDRIGKINTWHCLPVTDLCFSHDENYIITVGADKEAKMHSLERFKKKAAAESHFNCFIFILK